MKDVPRKDVIAGIGDPVVYWPTEQDERHGIVGIGHEGGIAAVVVATAADAEVAKKDPVVTLLLFPPPGAHYSGERKHVMGCEYSETREPGHFSLPASVRVPRDASTRDRKSLATRLGAFFGYGGDN